nr:MAG TPA: hypothetical protein [Caudoviricetes sp.]
MFQHSVKISAKKAASQWWAESNGPWRGEQRPAACEGVAGHSNSHQMCHTSSKFLNCRHPGFESWSTRARKAASLL